MDSDNEDQALMKLNYAKKKGVNSYVRLQIFPDMLLNRGNISIKKINIKSSSNDNEIKENDENDNIIITSICNETFTPIFEDQTSLEIKGDETEIVRWLSTDKKKGKAIGEIWHRFTNSSNKELDESVSDKGFSDEDSEYDSKDTDSEEVYKDILIGTFEINLDFLVNRIGISNKMWVPIFLPKKIVEFFKEKNTYSLSSFQFLGASIQISINMEKGFDTGAIFNSDNGIGTSILNSDLSMSTSIKTQLAKFKVKVNKIYLPINDNSEDINNQMIYLKWESPEVNSNKNKSNIKVHNLINGNKRYYYSERKPIKSTYVEEEGIVTNISDMNYEQEIIINYNSNVIEKLRDNQFEIEIWKIESNSKDVKPIKIYIGSCFIDIYDLVLFNRKTHKKRSMKKKSIPIVGIFPLINPNSSYMYGSKIDLSIELNVKSRSRNNSFISNTSYDSKINNSLYLRENHNDQSKLSTSTIQSCLMNKDEPTNILDESLSSIPSSIITSDIIEINETKYKNKKYNIPTPKPNTKNYHNSYFEPSSTNNSFEIEIKPSINHSFKEPLKPKQNDDISENININIKNKNSRRTCKLNIVIERAFHITIPKLYNQLENSDSNSKDTTPYVFVSLEWKSNQGESKIYKTEIRHDSSPIWNYEFSIEQEVDESFIKTMQDTPLQFKVWHISNKLYNKKLMKKNNISLDFSPYNHYLIGIANIYIKPLLSCVLREMRGWYNIVDNDLNSNGTIGISIKPNDDFFSTCKNLSEQTNLLLEKKFSSITTPLYNSNSKDKLNNIFDRNDILKSESLIDNNVEFKLNNKDHNHINEMGDSFLSKKYPFTLSIDINNNNNNNYNIDYTSINDINNTKAYTSINNLNYTSLTPTSNSNISFLNLKNQLTEKLTELESIQKDMLSKLKPNIDWNYNNNITSTGYLSTNIKNDITVERNITSSFIPTNTINNNKSNNDDVVDDDDDVETDYLSVINKKLNSNNYNINRNTFSSSLSNEKINNITNEKENISSSPLNQLFNNEINNDNIFTSSLLNKKMEDNNNKTSFKQKLNINNNLSYSPKPTTLPSQSFISNKKPILDIDNEKEMSSFLKKNKEEIKIQTLSIDEVNNLIDVSNLLNGIIKNFV